jgi:hypothetical protein
VDVVVVVCLGAAAGGALKLPFWAVGGAAGALKLPLLGLGALGALKLRPPPELTLWPPPPPPGLASTAPVIITPAIIIAEISLEIFIRINPYFLNTYLLYRKTVYLSRKLPFTYFHFGVDILYTYSLSNSIL